MSAPDTAPVLVQRIPCPSCGGDCSFEHWTGYDPRDGQPTGYIERCRACTDASRQVRT